MVPRAKHLLALRANASDQLLLSLTYFSLAAFSFLRPNGAIYTKITADSGGYITYVGMAVVFIYVSGLAYRKHALPLWQYILILTPLILFVSYLIYFAIVVTAATLTTAILSFMFLLSLIKNSFFGETA